MNFEENLNEILKSSSIHGLSNLFRTNRFLVKFLWSVLFLSSTCLCSFLVIQSIQQYLEYEVVTKIRIFKEQPAEFPVVTICNSNPFTSNEAVKFINDTLQKNNITDIFTTKTIYKGLKNISNNSHIIESVEMAYNFVMSHAKSLKLNHSKKKSLGLDFSKMFITCEFSDEPCNENDFEWHYEYYHGNCYRFNSKNSQLRKVAKPGKYDGLKLELYIGEIKTFFPSRGVFVSVSNNSYRPINFDGIEVPSNFETNIAIEKSFTEKIPKPYSECDLDPHESLSFDSDLYNDVIRLNSKYSQLDCFQLCVQRRFIEKCNCYDVSSNYTFENKHETKECLTFENFICITDAYRQIEKEGFNKGCFAKCPLECESVSYTMTTSQSKYPSKLYVDVLKKMPTIKEMYPNDTFTHDIAKDTTLKLNIFYRELKYTTLTEVRKMTIIDLLSEIGGTMGLFLGISVLSLFELVEFCLEFFLLRVKHVLYVDNRISFKK